MPDAARWREPTAALRLRWGHYPTRLLGGMMLLLAGGVAIAGGSPFATWLLAAGTAAHVAGWAILPSTGWRRVTAIIASTGAMWFLLTGPRWLWILVLPYAAWLLVRHRPLAAYPTIAFVLAGGVLIARLEPAYSDMLAALAAQGGIIVLSAWAARALHATRARVRARRTPSNPPA